MLRASNLLACAALLACAPAWPAAPKDEEPPEVRYAAMLEREYGPLGTTTEQILGREPTHEPVTIVGALVYRLRSKPLARLSLTERKLLAVYGLKEEVDNGGFSQYFSGPVGDGASLALQALRDMQAAQLVKTVQKALAVFPAAKPPADQVRRGKLVDGMKRRAQGVWAVCDAEFYLREEDLAKFAFAYVKKNRAQISLP
ncbi:MAG TPA: DUF4375 domain-containing protein [Steroidobacteraceae bacterium]|nr:DUF4375 domain-containing protein [Steroidobacteraceae bacterium]